MVGGPYGRSVAVAIVALVVVAGTVPAAVALDGTGDADPDPPGSDASDAPGSVGLDAGGPAGADAPGSVGLDAGGPSGADPPRSLGPNRTGAREPDRGGSAGDPGEPPNRSNGTPARGIGRDDLPAGDRGAPLRDFDPDRLGASAADSDRVRVVIGVEDGAGGSLGSRLAQLRSMGASVRTVSEKWIAVGIDPGRVGEYRRLAWVERVRRPFGASSTVVSEGVAVVSADDVHDAGFSGEDATVGVLDVAGFDVDNPEIGGNVVDWKSFRDGGIEQGSAHGTAVSEVVVDTAPDADLYVANFADVAGYQNAVDWLRSKGVDVIVMSVAFFGQPNDGSGPLTDVADDAVAGGTPWVNAAGNHARDHWEGEYADADGDGVHNFTGSDELNYLGGGKTLERGSSVGIWLTWSEWANSDENYDLYLYRVYENGSREVVASSTLVQDGDDRGYEEVSTRVPADGRYAVAVVDEGTSGPQNLELFLQAGGPLSIRTTGGSIIAPATGEGVTAVGAVDYSTTSLERFSSRGPTNDGRRGLNLVAPDRVSTSAFSTFAGTSAAAPHVGGVAALLASVDGSLSPAELEGILEDTADDLGPGGADAATGAGLVNASAAVASVTDQYPPPSDSSSSDPPVAASIGLEAPESVTTGASGTVSTSVTLNGSADRVRVTGRFDPAFASATVTEASVSGPGAVTSVDANRTAVAVTATDLTADSTLTVSYTVTAPSETGTHRIATRATVDGAASTGPDAEVTVESAEPTRPANPDASSIPDRNGGAPLADYDGSGGPVTVAVELAADADRDPGHYAGRVRDRGGTVEAVSDRWIRARVDPGTLGDYRALDWVAGVYRPHSAVATGTAGVDRAADPSSGRFAGAVATRTAGDQRWAGRLPSGVTGENVTGENVTVGVLDVAGFDPNARSISGNVAAARGFGVGVGPGDGHGTAVAESVLATAPGAELYLARFEGPAGYVNATRWLRSRGVDVVVSAASFYGAPGDGSGPVSAVADAAAGDGVVWVGAAGNAAEDHWRGRFSDADGDAIHDFAPGEEYDFLGGGGTLSAGQRVRAWLTWDAWPRTDADYDLYLFDGRGEVVAASTRRQDGDDPPRELVTYTVPEEGYYGLAVVRADAPGEATLDLTVEAGGPLSRATPTGSLLAPATARNVTAVSATGQHGSVTSFAGRGPTADGRPGVDLVAPGRASTAARGQFVGTSAAAARVGGAAALVIAAGSLSPSAVGPVLTGTADDLGPSGPDPATGAGRLNLTAAVEFATSRGPAVNATVEREAPDYLRAGASASVTTTVTVEEATDRVVLTDSFAPGVAGANVTDASVTGGGSIGGTTAGPTGVSVTATDLSDGSRVSVTYRVTVQEDGAGTLGVDATLTAGRATLDGPTTEVPVLADSGARSLSRRTVPPGGTVAVTTRVDVNEVSPRAAISERLDPSAVAEVEDVVVEGNGSELFRTPSAEGEISLALQGLDAGSAVAVTYSVTVPENLEPGEVLRITGDATVAGESRGLGTSDVLVVEGVSAYADDRGVVDTAGLREAIADWARGEIGTDLLSRVIEAWASGAPVE